MLTHYTNLYSGTNYLFQICIPLPECFPFTLQEANQISIVQSKECDLCRQLPHFIFFSPTISGVDCIYLLWAEICDNLNYMKRRECTNVLSRTQFLVQKFLMLANGMPVLIDLGLHTRARF